MSQYETLDAAIIERLGKSRYATFLQLDTASVLDESERIADLANRKAYRIVDARLQALRKAGKIDFTHGLGWRLSK